jgi:hypothetical protein
MVLLQLLSSPYVPTPDDEVQRPLTCYICSTPLLLLHHICYRATSAAAAVQPSLRANA